MRLLVLSDLHLEQAAPPEVDELDFDVAVLAVDFHSPGCRAVEWARLAFSRRPVVMVAGNHEFYGSSISAEMASMKRDAEGSDGHVLDRDSVILGGVRFLGCTLWTDFALAVVEPSGARRSDVESAMSTSRRRMNDYRLIRAETTVGVRRLQPEDTRRMHGADREWLRQVLEEPFDGQTVVVTHHGPSRGSVAPRYAADWVTPAFASDLPASFFAVPTLWIHGHSHASFDYRVSGCRVLSNPRGY